MYHRVGQPWLVYTAFLAHNIMVVFEIHALYCYRDLVRVLEMHGWVNDPCNFIVEGPCTVVYKQTFNLLNFYIALECIELSHNPCVHLTFELPRNAWVCDLVCCACVVFTLVLVMWPSSMSLGASVCGNNCLTSPLKCQSRVCVCVCVCVCGGGSAAGVRWVLAMCPTPGWLVMMVQVCVLFSWQQCQTWQSYITT